MAGGRVELARAEAARHAYVEHGRPAAKADLARSTRAMEDSPGFIVQHADPDDASFAQQVGIDLERYRQATGRLLAAIAAGNRTDLARIEAREVDPAVDELAEGLEDGAQDEREQAAASVAAQQQLGRAQLLAVPVVFTLGLGLLMGCWALLVGYQRRIKHQALTDALTGLPNRTLLYDRTGQAMRQADRELVPAALALIDLDRFKEVNDTLGHHYGDQLLLQVGQRLQASLEEPFVLEGLTVDVEASVGVAIYPDHGADPEELLQRADIAMYTAKETHAGFVLFDPRQDQHSPRRLALLGELRRALEQRQLLLHYEPKVDAHSGQFVGVEALVRWQHPVHGLVPPDEFIPLAERTGLIGPLTHYVLDEALRQGRQWSDAGHELSVAVNVSARRLLDLQFLDEVAALLERHQVPAEQLVIELTESTIMADPVHALDILLGLRVVAEGVENALTLQQLDLLGCHAVQGYHISRPVAPDVLISWIGQQAATTGPEPGSDGTSPTGHVPTHRG